MKPTLEQLKAAKEVYQTELSKLHNIISREEALPRVKKLVGKYFKYKNSYGTHERWWMYTHIKESTSDLDLIIDTVQADRRGKIEFVFDRLDNHYVYDSTNYIEIPKKEYITAKRFLMKQLNKHFKQESK